MPEGISELAGITDNMLARGISLEKAVSELEALPCGDTPFVFTGEDFTAGFLNAAFLCCGKTFDRPYLAIDKLANIPFMIAATEKLNIVVVLVEMKSQISTTFGAFEKARENAWFLCDRCASALCCHRRPPPRAFFFKVLSPARETKIRES